jgi:glycerate dehydrogenase
MQSPYTFITSHIAWQPKAARLRAVDLAVKNFRSYLEGMPTSVIN